MPNQKWGYDNTDHQFGPEEWSKHYKTGELQSPINIQVDPSKCGQLVGCTCCRPPPSSGGLSQRWFERVAARLPGRLLIVGIREQRTKRRLHLDSTGAEDTHQRSSSASSESSTGGSRDGNRSFVSSSSASSSSSSSTQDHNLLLVDTLIQQRAQKSRYCVSNERLLCLRYPSYLGEVELCNTGHAWQINLPPKVGARTRQPFANRQYRLAQFHCHWGEHSHNGSEHTVNGKSFAAEIHFVHWNCSQFESVEEASRHKHGLAVVAVFVEAGVENNKNRQLDKIIASLNRIQKPGSSVNINTKLDPMKLFPANRSAYASYEGSLTTPPLSEVVDWLVFFEPIKCSSSQIDQFRQLGCSSKQGKNIANNCRPIQPSNNRLVSIWTGKTHRRLSGHLHSAGIQ